LTISIAHTLFICLPFLDFHEWTISPYSYLFTEHSFDFDLKRTMFWTIFKGHLTFSLSLVARKSSVQHKFIERKRGLVAKKPKWLIICDSSDFNHSILEEDQNLELKKMNWIDSSGVNFTNISFLHFRYLCP